MSLPDFLHPNLADHGLRRGDLGILRAAARAPYGIESTRDVGESILRLENAGLLVGGWRRRGLLSTMRWTATKFGRETIKANASCIDGTEGLPILPARMRGEVEDAMELVDEDEVKMRIHGVRRAGAITDE